MTGPSSQVEPPVNPLISPRIIELSRNLTSAQVTSPQDGRSPSKWEFNRVPPQLLSFIQTPSLETLTSVLTRHYFFYWHPIVVEQMLHLYCLMHDPEEWKRLGWLVLTEHMSDTWEPSGSPGMEPEKWQRVCSATKALLEAHVTSILPGFRIEWKRKKGKSGPHPLIENPYPVNDAPLIDTQVLYLDWGSLRDALKVQMQKERDLWLRPRSSRIVELKDQVMQVLSKTDIAAWSSLREFESSAKTKSVAPENERGLQG